MGSPIPFEDFGGRGPLLHFAHANAYPPATYSQLLKKLAEDFTVLAMQQRPLWPGSKPEEIENWSDLAKDTSSFFDQQGIRQVIGIGHSLGAITTMMAAQARPELFRLLILIEPVILIPAVLDHFRQQPESGQPYNTPLVDIALRRRNGWRSHQEAFEHFRAKSVFSRITDQTLWDYVRYGLMQTPTGEYQLRFSPEWEARIYSRPPLEVWEIISEIMQPMLIIRGLETDTLSTKAWQLLQQVQSNALFTEVSEAGHLVPLEQPEKIATIIESFVKIQDSTQ